MLRLSVINNYIISLTLVAFINLIWFKQKEQISAVLTILLYFTLKQANFFLFILEIFHFV
mgnify:FL=1